MAVPRLTFLYPHGFRVTSRSEPYLAETLHTSRRGSQKASFSTFPRRKLEEVYAQRYGTAAEPLPPPIPGSLGGAPVLSKDFGKETKPTPPKPEEKKVDPEKAATKPAQEAKEVLNTPPESNRTSAVKTTLSAELDASESHPKQAAERIQPSTSTPLETVLQLDPASGAKAGEEHKPPHLQAPPYVHHFDTFTLVKDLQKGGFTQDQSVTVMKAVRGLLAKNLDVAREGLVSKSDIENENYLFRAACSELRTEILNTRRTRAERTRTELSHLQHDYEILSQKTTQDVLALKDDLRGMFNERKMSNRMQQQARESAIQELNYKITVGLNSGSKSEVEGLRWVLTRRAAMAIASMAVLILGSLRYVSYVTHIQDQERKAAAVSSSSSTSTGSGGNYTVPSREMSTQTGEGTEVLVANMDSVG